MFLKIFRGFCKWFRDEKDELVEYFKTLGLDGTSAIIRIVRIPPVALWRWSTLPTACKECKHLLAMFRNHWVHIQGYLNKMKDGTQVGKVRIVLTDVAFVREFTFVDWYTDRLKETSEWGTKCMCEAHQEDYKNGKNVDCLEKGRVLPWAWNKCCLTLNDLLCDANSWDLGTWGGGKIFLRQVRGMVKAVYSRGKQKTVFLDEVPYILARLGREVGIGPKAILQYDAVPVSRHIKISIELLDSESVHREEIASSKDELKLSAPLRDRILAIQKTNMNDKLAEGPHSVFSKEADRARAADFPWVSSTCRLAQNLVDVRKIPELLNVPLQTVWDRWKTLLQTDRHWQRNKRCSLAEFSQRVYCCRHEFNPDESANESTEDAITHKSKV